MGLPVNDWTGRITGSAYTDLVANKITAPHGKVIIAIQCVGDHGVDNVIANVVAEDPSMYAGSPTAAHTGTASDTANDGSSTVAAGTAITMTTSYATKGYAVGWYVDGVGVPYGTKVTEVNVGGDPLEIKLDNAFECTDQTIYFTDPTDTTHGSGGRSFTDGTDLTICPNQGTFLYGRWVSCEIGADTQKSGLICYFGE